MKYIFEKSILTEMLTGTCNKNVVNRLHKSWISECASAKINGIIEDENYIINKLGLNRITVPDKPPLAKYTKEGKVAENALIDEIAYRKAIGTNLIDNKNKKNQYIDFEDTVNDGTDLIFNKSNRDNIKLNKNNFNNEDFSVDFSEKSKVDINKFKKLMDPSKYNYIYQFKFSVENDFFVPFIKNASTVDELKKYDIVFRRLVPDFIKLINRDCDKHYVFDKTFNLVKPSANKIKLQVCDIKMSEFTNKFFIELGLYMIALNSFIFNNKLDDYYEVVADGVILPKRNNESEQEREDRIKAADYKLEEWQCDYTTVKDKLEYLFNNELLKVITIVESGDIKKYNNFKITPKCQTCDNYGGQYSENLKNYIEKYNNDNGTSYTIDSFYNDLDNQYCRYIVRNTENINKLPCLQKGEKNVLLKNKIDDLKKLETELNTSSSKVINENIALKSDSDILKENIKLRESKGSFSYISNSKTMNLCKNSTLKIYIDERHDSQGRSLSFSFMYRFSGKDPDGVAVKEDNFKNPYIAIIDDDEFTIFREKKEFLDYLIEINKVLDKYENYKNSYNQVSTFSIIYWGDKGIEHLRDLFLGIFKYLYKKGTNISELYPMLPPTKLNEKKKEIAELLERFNSFFTSDNELEDYRIIERNPFCNLKKAVEDIVALNIDIYNTLYEVNNVLAGEAKKPIYHKPDSDEFNGWVFSNVWQVWTNSVPKRNFITSLEHVLKDRLFCMLKINIQLDRKYLKGQAPAIPKLKKINGFKNLQFGLELYLMQKLNAAYSLIEKENIHTQQVYKKTVLGKSMLLSEEILTNKETLLKKHFGKTLFNKDEYKIYRVDKNSLDANYDESSFAPIIYPVDKSDYIYMKFSKYSSPNCISYSEGKDLVDVNLFNYDRETKKRTTKNYKQAMQLEIIKFNYIDEYIIIKLKNDTSKIIDFLESNYGFDFSKDVILESIHVDIWSKRLEDCLARVEKDSSAKELLETYNPTAVNSYTVDIIKDILEKHLGSKSIPLDDSQFDAIVNIMNNKLTLLWGPPGTGKSHTISYLLLLYYLIINNGEKRRILIMGNYDATNNIAQSCSKLLDYSDVSIVRVKSKGKEKVDYGNLKNLKYYELETDTRKLDYKDTRNAFLQQENKLQVFTSTPDQMLNAFVSTIRSFKFDLVIVDEASQMDVGHFIAGLIKIHAGTQFLLAGDNLQLSPITNVKLKNPQKNIYGSVFDYYNNEFSMIYPSIKSDLLYNRRSNSVIVDFAKFAFCYPNKYTAVNKDGKIYFDEKLDMKNFYDRILNPEEPLTLLRYDDGNSSQLNIFEAEETIKIVKNIWDKKLCEYGKAKNIYNNNLYDFFDKGIGIVVPHRAQKSRIQNMLLDYFNSIGTMKGLTPDDEITLKNKIMSAVDTVEKYQGQQREIMICSFVLGDEDIINQEEQFIYNPNRLNVMISRARFKAIVIASNELMNNISDDIEVIELQKSLQALDVYCDKEEEINEAIWKSRNGIMKNKGFI